MLELEVPKMQHHIYANDKRFFADRDLSHVVTKASGEVKTCTVCGCNESELLATCPGVRLTFHELKAIKETKMGLRRSSVNPPTIEEYNLFIGKV